MVEGRMKFVKYLLFTFGLIFVVQVQAQPEAAQNPEDGLDLTQAAAATGQGDAGKQQQAPQQPLAVNRRGARQQATQDPQGGEESQTSPLGDGGNAEVHGTTATASGDAEDHGTIATASGDGGDAEDHGTIATASGDGGDVKDHGTIATASGDGGDAEDHGTIATASGDGGDVKVHGTIATANGDGGDVKDHGTIATASGDGGDAEDHGTIATANGDGGDVKVHGTIATASGDGGDAEVHGTIATASGDGGDVKVHGTIATASGDGGDVQVHETTSIASPENEDPQEVELQSPNEAVARSVEAGVHFDSIDDDGGSHSQGAEGGQSHTASHAQAQDQDMASGGRGVHIRGDEELVAETEDGHYSMDVDLRSHEQVGVPSSCENDLVYNSYLRLDNSCENDLVHNSYLRLDNICLRSPFKLERSQEPSASYEGSEVELARHRRQREENQLRLWVAAVSTFLLLHITHHRDSRFYRQPSFSLGQWITIMAILHFLNFLSNWQPQ